MSGGGPDDGGRESYSAEEAGEMSAAAQARFAEVDEKSAAKQAQTAEHVAMLKEAAAQDEWVRSVGYEPDPMLSEPDKGILVEEMPADKLLRLRKGAADRAPGYTGGTGSFSQSAMTPEIADREAENARWLSGQDERDARFALTPQQQQRSPEAAELASDRLPALQQQQRLASRQANTDKMVDAITGTSGFIDPKDVEKLQLLDPTINIPSSRIGVSREQAVAALQSELESLYTIAGTLSAKGIITGDNRVLAANRLSSEIQKALMLLSKPGVDPNVVIAEYRMVVSKIQTELMPSGEIPTGGRPYEKVD
jgi:hypothetical protein